MSLKLYSTQGNPRSHKALIAAEYNGVKIELPTFEMGKTNKSEEFLAKFPMGKQPALETPEGPIAESNAIARYVARVNPTTNLMGSTVIQQSQVDQWIDFSSLELESNVGGWLYQHLGYLPLNPAGVESSKANLLRALGALDAHLTTKTFVVGQRITLADIILGVTLNTILTRLFAQSSVSKFVNLQRYFNTLVNQPQFAKFLGKPEFPKVDLVPNPAAAKPAAAAPAPAAAAAPAVELDDNGLPIEKKAKSPLDLLPESPMGHIDVTKKLMFSERPILPDFFEKHWPMFDPEGFTWFLCKYNYDSDNTVYFKTGNAVGGFLQRSDAARKFSLGVMNILGQTEEKAPYYITGAWMFRGKDVAPEMMQENPDAEYYTWTKVDVTTDAGKQSIKEQFMGDKIGDKNVLDRRYFK